MRKLWFLAAAVWIVSALPAHAQFFSDSFDTYATGSTIAGQGGWETWDQVPSADTTVVSTQAFNPPNSLFVAVPADIVHQFAGLNSGTWFARTMTYVPSTQQGDMFLILMNTYVVGTHNNPDWSAQIVLCTTNCTSGIPGMVFSVGGGEVGGGGSIPLINDAWVELRVQIDLTNNMYQAFYGGQQFESQQWTLTNPLTFQAVDLYSQGSTESYMDLAWVDTSAPVNLMMFSVE